MSKAERHPDHPSQVVLYTPHEQLTPTTALAGEAIVDLQEQAAYMSLTLGYLDTASLHGSYLRMTQYPDWLKAQTARYGKSRVENTILGKLEQKQIALEDAASEFRRAIGADTMVTNGLLTADQATELVAADFALFMNQYGDENGSHHEQRKQLQAFYNQRLAGEPVSLPTRPNYWTQTIDSYDANASTRVGLTHALRPGFLGFKKEPYQAVSDGFIERVQPSVLRASLVDVAGSSKNAWAYRPKQDRRLRYITLGPTDRVMLLRSSPEKHAEKATNVTEIAIHNTVQSDPDWDKPRRSGNHAVETIEATMEKYIRHVLDPNLALVARFREAAQHGNLQRFGSEANMRAQLIYVWDYVIPDMLWAARIARQSSREGEDHARLALEKWVFMPANGQARIKNFDSLLRVVQIWTQAKKDYTLYQLAETDRFLRENYTDEERATRAQRRVQAAA